jgi:hypothetical protein
MTLADLKMFQDVTVVIPGVALDLCLGFFALLGALMLCCIVASWFRSSASS